MAKLYFRYGAMSSGKTAALLQTAHNYEERGMRVFILKPAIDSKGGKAVVSRLGLERAADAMVRLEDNLQGLLEAALRAEPFACVLVDEATFLKSDQIEALFWFAITQDIPVLAYGLRTDFQTKGFPGSARLLELAHEITELKTICRCGRKAVFNARKVDGTFVNKGSQIEIDDKAHIEYEALCAKDYQSLVLQAQ